MLWPPYLPICITKESSANVWVEEARYDNNGDDPKEMEKSLDKLLLDYNPWRAYAKRPFLDPFQLTCAEISILALQVDLGCSYSQDYVKAELDSCTDGDEFNVNGMRGFALLFCMRYTTNSLFPSSVSDINEYESQIQC